MSKIDNVFEDWIVQDEWHLFPSIYDTREPWQSKQDVGIDLDQRWIDSIEG